MGVTLPSIGSGSWGTPLNAALSYLDGLSYTAVGDSDATLTYSSSNVINRWTSTLTANRTVTLSTSGAVTGTRFFIARSGGGSFTLDVGGLISLAANEWCGVVYNGSAYVVFAMGALNNTSRTFTNATITNLTSTVLSTNRLEVVEGSNAKMGTATLVAGTVTVNTTAVTASSRIFLTAQNTGGTAGALRVSARVNGTSFTITSTSGTDTSSVAWLIIEPV
jgi:hypothetical protein